MAGTAAVLPLPSARVVAELDTRGRGGCDLEQDAGELAPTVRDDGKGISAAAESGTGLSLQIMQYRAGTMSGRCTVARPTAAAPWCAAKHRCGGRADNSSS